MTKIPGTGALPGTADDARRNALPTDDRVPALPDRLDIHILDVAAALQILIAEVRVELGLPAGLAPLPAAVFSSPLLPAPSAAQAARQLVQMFLLAVPPAPPDTAASSVSPMMQIEATLRLALDRAVAVVAAWRDVSETVVDAAKDTRALVVTLLSDEPPSPLWFQTEWLTLAPQMRRFWRRRDQLRRRLADPDTRPRQSLGDVTPDKATSGESDEAA